MFVHGGAFIAGSTRAPMCGGSAFARDGIVFVTVNYRLGVPGFLHLPDAPDNRGSLDVLAALRWVSDNAVAFGGDPGRVTLAGQSAGGIIVSGLVAGTEHRENALFQRAIIESGSAVAAFTPAQADVVTTAVADALGVTGSAEAMALVPDARLVEVVAELPRLDLAIGGAYDPLGALTSVSLVLDEQPAVTAAMRSNLPVDLLIGSNLDESNLYLVPLGPAPRHAVPRVPDPRATAARFHPDGAALAASYRAHRPAASESELALAILSDGMFGLGTRRFADAHAPASASTFVYEFTWRSDALQGRLGSSHLMELPFVFDLVSLPALHGPDALLGEAPPPADLARRMHAAWVAFARSGDPGWPPYTPATRVVQQIGEQWSVREHHDVMRYGAW